MIKAFLIVSKYEACGIMSKHDLRYYRLLTIVFHSDIDIIRDWLLLSYLVRAFSPSILPGPPKSSRKTMQVCVCLHAPIPQAKRR